MSRCANARPGKAPRSIMEQPRRTCISSQHYRPPPLCPRDLVCPSPGLYGGTLRPDPLKVNVPLPLILLPSSGSGKPRPADVLRQGLWSQAWLREKVLWKGLCIRGKSAPNNSQIRVQAVQVKAGRKLQPLEAFSPRDLIKAEECWSQN